MRAAQLLQAQLQGINTLFHSVLDDLTDEEWTTRVFPDTNLMAFDLWHVARTLDTTVHLGICDVPEVVSQERWTSCGTLTTPGFGLNLSREQADAIARGVTRADLAAYSDAVSAAVHAWLETVSDGDLDAVPDLAAHVAHEPIYQQDPALFKEVVEGSEETPIWTYLSGPCIGHCRGHLGQLILLKEQLRLHASVPAAEPAAASPAPAKTVASAKHSRWPWGRK
jgi:hypothetical protein